MLIAALHMTAREWKQHTYQWTAERNTVCLYKEIKFNIKERLWHMVQHRTWETPCPVK